MYTESKKIQNTMNLRRFNVNLRDSKCIESSKIQIESSKLQCTLNLLRFTLYTESQKIQKKIHM